MTRLVLTCIIVTPLLLCQTRTAVTMASSANPSIFGQVLTLSASVAPALAAGKVTFYDGTTPLGITAVVNGSASLSLTLPSAGVRSLQARFSGGGTYVSGVSPALTETVSLVSSATFRSPVVYSTANAINQHVAAADFNGDGHLDIVTNNYTVLMGNGDGTFRAPQIYSYSSNSYAVATGDFNGDGKPDFATAGFDGNVDVWLNKGDGTFQSPLLVPTGTGPEDLAVGDFNNDGIADIAFVSRQGQALGVGILLGVGDGSFRPIVTYLAGQHETALAIADFNSDGNADIVAVDSDDSTNQVTVLLGAGDGTFHSAATYNTGARPESVAIGDFNKDGKPDLVIADYSVNYLNVFTGNGDGTFGQPIVLPLTPTQSGAIDCGVVTGDFDGDGNPDLAWVAGGAAVSIFMGKGDGTFHGAVNFPAGSDAGSLIAAEFNGDGRTDLAVTNTSSIQILLGGAGVFPTVTTTSVPAARGGAAYSTTFTATGGATPYTWSLSAGTVPLTLSSAGILGGTPTTNITSATDPFTVVVGGPNGPGFYSSQSLSLQVGAALQINTQNANVVWKVGVPYQVTLGTSYGTPPFTSWTVATGALPPGLNLDPNSGTISGTPTAAGTFTCTVTVTDSTGLLSLPATLRIVVVGALTMVTHSVPNGFTGVPYYVVLQGTGGYPPYIDWTVATGALPPGLSLDPNSGVITGTPTATTGSPFTFTITFSDGNTVSPPQTFTVSVSTPGPGTMILTAALDPLSVGKLARLTATVPSGTGKVAFYDGANILGTATIANGKAVFTTSLLGTGTHVLKARCFSPPLSASISQVFNANPDASFLSPVNYSIPNQEGLEYISPMLTVDFNHDGIADLASFVSVGLDESIAVRLGNGDGTFQAALLQPVASGAVSMAIGDFNEDGIPDIALSTGLGLSLYLGKGDGTFSAGVNQSVSGLSGIVLAADFNGDGHSDLIVTYAGNQAQLYLGIGDGTFRPPLNVALGTNPAALAVGDFNGDGIPDLVSGNYSTGSVNVILGNGDGTFQPLVTYPVVTPASQSSSFFINLADLNGDGFADLLVSGTTPGAINVLLGRGDGTFGPAASYAFLGGSTVIAISDFNGDGIPDLLVPGIAPASFTLLLGNGDGSFRAGLSYPSNIRGYSPAVGDFNGDGLPDIALALGSGATSVLLGSSVVGADQLTFSPASLTVSVSANSTTATPPQTVTLTYQTTTPGTYTFSQTGQSAFNWVTASPASGPMTLASSSGSLYTYTAQVNLTFNPSFAGGYVELGTFDYAANGAPASLPVSFSVGTLARLTGIVNAASGGQGTPSVVSTGSYVAIYGSGIAGTDNPSATSIPLPNTLNGIQATLGGLPMPLLYASATQINAIVPQGLSPNNSYPLLILNPPAGVRATVNLLVQELQPAIYTLDTSGSGPAIVADAVTGLLISATNPAHASQYLVIYCTGLGPVLGPNGEPEPADGAAAPETTVFHTRAVTTATLGGVSTPVLFSGLTPTLVGLYQVNIQVPAGVKPGAAVSLVIQATDSQTGATSQSNSVTITVQ